VPSVGPQVDDGSLHTYKTRTIISCRISLYDIRPRLRGRENLNGGYWRKTKFDTAENVMTCRRMNHVEPDDEKTRKQVKF